MQGWGGAERSAPRRCPEATRPRGRSLARATSGSRPPAPPPPPLREGELILARRARNTRGTATQSARGQCQRTRGVSARPVCVHGGGGRHGGKLCARGACAGPAAASAGSADPEGIGPHRQPPREGHTPIHHVSRRPRTAGGTVGFLSRFGSRCLGHCVHGAPIPMTAHLSQGLLHAVDVQAALPAGDGVGAANDHQQHGVAHLNNDRAADIGGGFLRCGVVVAARWLLPPHSLREPTAKLHGARCTQRAGWACSGCRVPPSD
jgi:hypothetical protein